jgi:hypothetical protein
MGLLEDAIREHLELKRLRGADPTEVAREQREALEPPNEEAQPTSVENHAGGGEDGIDTAGHALAADLITDDDHAGEEPEPPVPSELSHAAQETAELDMTAAMADEHAIEDEHTPPEGLDMPEGEGEPSGASDEDSLEWEVPARSHDAEAEFGQQAEQNPTGAGEIADEQDPPPGPVDDGREGSDKTQEHTPGQGRLSL